MKSGIYIIRCIVNGKSYIGSSINIQTRIGQHIRALRNKRHHSYHLQRAFDLHGESHFESAVIELCPLENLVEREQYWMDRLNSCSRDHGFNIHPKADLSRISVETIEKIKAAKKLNPPVISEAQREAIRRALTGKPSWNKGKPLSETHKKALSESRFRFFANGNIPWNKGIPMTKEVKSKVSESRKGKGIGNTNGFQKGHGFWLGKKRPNVSGRFNWRNRRKAQIIGTN